MMFTEVMRENKLFQLCYNRGEYFPSRCLVIYVRCNHLPVNRLGITTGKKIGNAVCRSRARRIIRQAWRENEADAPIGLDIVIVARKPIEDAASTELSEYLRKKGIPALHKFYRKKNEKPAAARPADTNDINTNQ